MKGKIYTCHSQKLYKMTLHDYLVARSLFTETAIALWFAEHTEIQMSYNVMSLADTEEELELHKTLIRLVCVRSTILCD